MALVTCGSSLRYKSSAQNEVTQVKLIIGCSGMFMFLIDYWLFWNVCVLDCV